MTDQVQVDWAPCPECRAPVPLEDGSFVFVVHLVWCEDVRDGDTYVEECYVEECPASGTMP